VSLLEVSNLTVSARGTELVHDTGFVLEPGRRVGLIGESGSGKSMTALAVMGLLPEGLSATGAVRYRGQELLGLRERELARLRGDRIAMIFQEPMTALNPVMRVGDQVAEVLRLHRGESARVALEHAVQLLSRVRLPDPAAKLRAYPHQLSGGQRQRVMIAIALACGPDLLIADEPTTALDVTVQAQILVLLHELVEEEGAALLLITHDLPVVASVCDEVMVMYAGRIVERGHAAAVLADPHHPYTRGLLDAIPTQATQASRRLAAIPGSVPAPGHWPSGCVFRDRCPRATEECLQTPALVGDEHAFACWHPLGLAS
jgi:peptide/nickel transport system ATP-binding protein